MTAALMVSVQTTVFRYMRERMMENGYIDCNVTASPFRQTLLGTLSDLNRLDNLQNNSCDHHGVCVCDQGHRCPIAGSSLC